MGYIDQFISKLKKDKKLEAHIFYEESPIKVVLPVLDIDFERKRSSKIHFWKTKGNCKDT